MAAGAGGGAGAGRAPGRGRGAGGRVNPQGVGMLNPPGEGPAKTPAPGVAGNRKGRPALGEASLTGPGGRQLQARVQGGAITAQQAKRTMSQRQTLAKALGANWRNKLQVGGESFAQVNKQLKANPGNAKLAAIRKRLITNRSKVLEAARAKNKGASAEPAAQGTEEGQH